MEEELAEHHSAIRRWSCSSAVVMLSDAKLAALIALIVGLAAAKFSHPTVFQQRNSV
jgi:hypothetical protein